MIPKPTDPRPAGQEGNVCDSCLFMATKINSQYCMINIREPMLVDMDMPSCSEWLETKSSPLTVMQYQALSSSDLARRLKEK